MWRWLVYSLTYSSQPYAGISRKISTGITGAARNKKGGIMIKAMIKAYANWKVFVKV